MKILVLGASGCIGRQIVSQCIAAGFSMTAVVRRANATLPDPKLRVVCGDLFDPGFLRNALRATDAVLSTLGSRRINRPTTVYSAGTAAAVDAVHETGVRRFIGATAAPAAPKGQTSGVSRWIVHPILYQFFGAAYEDMRRMEDMLAASDLIWTVFRPPRLLNLLAFGLYRTAIDAPLPQALSCREKRVGIGEIQCLAMT